MKIQIQLHNITSTTAQYNFYMKIIRWILFVNNFVKERIAMFWGDENSVCVIVKISFLSDEGFPGGLSLSANPLPPLREAIRAYSPGDC